MKRGLGLYKILGEKQVFAHESGIRFEEFNPLIH